MKVRRLGVLRGVFSGTAEIKAPLCAAIHGFSLHAGVLAASYEREKLEKVARYIARPAIREDRLSNTPTGDILYKLKKSYSDGTTHLILSPLELLEKMASLVPPPRVQECMSQP